MPFLVGLLLAFAPGLFWLWLIYKKDKYRPEPVALVVRTFLLGAAVAIPVSVVESILYPGSADKLLEQPTSLALAAYVSFIVAGVTEELGKYLVVKQTIYSSPYFDEPMDGLIYASAAALGFASLENVGYLFTFGWQIILVRGPFSTLAHVLFSAVWGYLLGREKLRHGARHSLVIAGLVLSMVAHGLFDFLLLSQRGYEPLVIPLFLSAGVLFLVLLNLADKASPYRERVAVPLVPCPNCGHRVNVAANFCTGCGAALKAYSQGNEQLCSKCGSAVRPQDLFCTSCGSRLNRKFKRLAAQWTSSS